MGAVEQHDVRVDLPHGDPQPVARAQRPGQIGARPGPVVRGDVLDRKALLRGRPSSCREGDEERLEASWQAPGDRQRARQVAQSRPVRGDEQTRPEAVTGTTPLPLARTRFATSVAHPITASARRRAGGAARSGSRRARAARAPRGTASRSRPAQPPRCPGASAPGSRPGRLIRRRTNRQAIAGLNLRVARQVAKLLAPAAREK